MSATIIDNAGAWISARMPPNFDVSRTHGTDMGKKWGGKNASHAQDRRFPCRFHAYRLGLLSPSLSLRNTLAVGVFREPLSCSRVCQNAREPPQPCRHSQMGLGFEPLPMVCQLQPFAQRSGFPRSRRGRLQSARRVHWSCLRVCDRSGGVK